MNHLQKQTEIITKEELREMMRTNNANKFFKFNTNPKDYKIIPKDDYYLEGPCLLQIFELINEDNTKSISISIYATFNKTTKNFEPELCFENFIIHKDEPYETQFEAVHFGIKNTGNIQYDKEDWWQQLENHMRTLFNNNKLWE